MTGSKRGWHPTSACGYSANPQSKQGLRDLGFREVEIFECGGTIQRLVVRIFVVFDVICKKYLFF